MAHQAQDDLHLFAFQIHLTIVALLLTLASFLFLKLTELFSILWFCIFSFSYLKGTSSADSFSSLRS